MSLNSQRLSSLLTHVLSNDILQQICLKIYPCVDSTNQIVWNLMTEGLSLPLVVIAEQQTAGRGQRGHSWLSASGGLYLSLGVAPLIPATDAPHLTLCSAWGIADALRSHHIPVSLKWLNDFLLKGYKLGGIRIETRIQQQQISRAVIGVGLNWSNPVPSVGINLQSFLSSQNDPSITSLEQLAAITIGGLVKGYDRYLSEGIEEILSDYLTLLSNMNQIITIEGCPARIMGVTTQGELKVQWRSPGAVSEACFAPGAISLGYPT